MWSNPVPPTAALKNVHIEIILLQDTLIYLNTRLYLKMLFSLFPSTLSGVLHSSNVVIFPMPFFFFFNQTIIHFTFILRVQNGKKTFPSHKQSSKFILIVSVLEMQMIQRPWKNIYGHTLPGSFAPPFLLNVFQLKHHLANRNSANGVPALVSVRSY